MVDLQPSENYPEKKYCIFIETKDGSLSMMAYEQETKAHIFLEIARTFEEDFRQVWMEEL